MGGYGENLRAKINGYQINAEGMRVVVALKAKKDIPIIHDPSAFQHFISDTPMLTRAVAIIDYSTIMYAIENYPSEYMAIMYEKRPDSDAVYFYSSKEITSLDMLDSGVCGTYFNKKTHLCFPSEERTDFTDFDSHPTFAAEDAIRLSSFDELPARTDKNRHGFFFSEKLTPEPKVNYCQFTLDDVFQYPKEVAINEHVNLIIGLSDDDLLDNQDEKRNGPKG